MSRRLRERLEALETAREAKTGVSVWWDPSDPQPEDWDTADIQVRFPDATPALEDGIPGLSNPVKTRNKTLEREP